MLQPGSKITIADNSGAKRAKLIGGFANVKRDKIRIGDFASVAVKKAQPLGLVKDHQVVRVLIIRTRSAINRPDGTVVRFDDNAGVVVNADGNPVGTRIFGPVAREVRARSPKVISMAEEVV